jgi:ribosomal protein S18 acetylase RimI-like enzyme
MITIRKATIKDLELVQNFNKKLHVYESQYSDEFDEEWVYSESGRAQFENRLKGRNSIVYIAEDNGQPVGFAMAHIFKAFMRKRIDKIGFLEYLYVEDKYRNKGIGAMLLEKVENFLRDKKISRIRLTTFTTNTDAIRFYSAHGIDKFVFILEGNL